MGNFAGINFHELGLLPNFSNISYVPRLFNDSSESSMNMLVVAWFKRIVVREEEYEYLGKRIFDPISWNFAIVIFREFHILRNFAECTVVNFYRKMRKI